MGKFFIETSPYHDNGTLIETLFNDAKSAIDYAKEHVKDEGFNIYEIGDTKLINYDWFGKPDGYPDFLSSSEYQVFEINKSKVWHLKRGLGDSWNEHVLKYNLGEEYLIK